MPPIGGAGHPPRLTRRAAKALDGGVNGHAQVRRRFTPVTFAISSRLLRIKASQRGPFTFFGAGKRQRQDRRTAAVVARGCAPLPP